MSTTTELGMNNEIPFAPAPAEDDPARGREVYAPVDQPFEAPAKELVEGPYYKGIEEVIPELTERPDAEVAGYEAKSEAFSVDRRNFMKLFSASTIAATSACVRRPVETAIPYVVQPIDQVPGEPVYYATTCGECSSGCGIMVKTREGRPTKLEGLPDHPISNGKLCAIGQASIQGLYHPERLKQPLVRFAERLEPVNWEDAYEHLGARLKRTTNIGIFTTGSTGHKLGFYKEFLERLGSSGQKLYTYDSNSLMESIIAAHEKAYGLSAMPRADLHQARLIVGIGADFLDVGTSGVYHTKAYSDMHGFANGTKGRHVQFETILTQTGSMADERHVIAPGAETLATLLLVRALDANSRAKGSAAARTQVRQILADNAALIDGGYERLGIKKEIFEHLAEDLLATSSVVLCGGSGSFDENATNLQLAAIMANELIGAYDSVLHLQRGWMMPPVKTGDLQRFLSEAGSLDVLFVVESNPAFSIPQSHGVADILRKIPTVVSIQSMPSETDAFASYVLPAHHYLESWGDEQPVAGFWSARQPTVRPTLNTRQAEDMFLWLAAAVEKPMGYAEYRDYLRHQWQSLHTMLSSGVDFDTFFDAVLHRGFVGKVESQAFNGVTGLASSFKYVDAGRGGLRLISPLDSRLRDGQHASKPVLQDAGDPLTTIAWDSWLAINPTTAQKLGLKLRDVVLVEGPGGSFEVAVFPLPGLHPDAVVVPRGNGHAVGSGTIEGGVGVDPLQAFSKAVDTATGAPVTVNQPVKLTLTGKKHALPAQQRHNDIGNRQDIIKKISLKTAAANVNKTKDLDTVPDLFPTLPKREYRWGMAIDLTKCTGCRACNVACSLENNVPQTGREEFLIGREMHWLKIDRYFSGSTDNPTVTFQPMLCQHCNHAPCEAVCPVFATTHDAEGVNAMTYNRCVGTRYCANACPYKIRRFNWFTYKWGVMGERLQDRNIGALNPDVTVRTRGVMEKCNFCYQRLRDAKHKARLRGTPLVDGEVKVACQQTCAAEAIVFGNLNDPESMVSRMRRDHRAYLALNGDPEHGHYNLKTVPNVSYLAAVTLQEPDTGDHHG